MQLTKDQINTIAEALRRQRGACWTFQVEMENIGQAGLAQQFMRQSDEADALRVIFEDANSVEVFPFTEEDYDAGERAQSNRSDAGIKVLATIELDRPDKARGELFYRDGDIWCRVVGSDETFATETGATEETAAQVIADAWRLPCWDLQWVENGGAA